jgi:predicted TIM-barrel fold metal-dependent hydrolase
MQPDVKHLIDVMDELFVAAIVNLDGRWGSELEQNLDRYDRAYPGRFATFAHVDWSLMAVRGGAQRLPEVVRKAKLAGAAGIKVWKDLGLYVRDDQRRLVLPDDARLSPVWDLAGELDLPVLMHTGDPVAFWAPPDRHNERFEELARHPDWRYGSARFPTHRRLLESLENVVAAHPHTTFIGAHVASHAENLANVSRLLGAYPNLFVDLSARESELGRQPRAAHDFIVAHSDRILFGTDCFPVDPRRYRIWFRMLQTSDEYFRYSVDGPPDRGRWNISGLALDSETLVAIYSGNARRVIPAFRSGGRR